MINLLPPEDKKRLRAARRNTIWVRYNLFLFAALIALNIVIGAVAFMIQIDKGSIQAKIADNQQTNSSVSAEKTKKQVETLKADMKIAKTLLDNQPDYLYGIINFYSSIPENCIFPTIGSEQLTYNKQYTATFNCRYPSSDSSVDTQAELASYITTELTKGLAFKNPIITSIKEASGENADYPFSLSFKTTSQDPLSSIKSLAPKGCVPKMILALESPKIIALDCNPTTTKGSATSFEEPIYESRDTFETRINTELGQNKNFINLGDVKISYKNLPNKEYSKGDDFSAFVVLEVEDIKVTGSGTR